MTSGIWTFAFVDLAGFTSVAEAHGDEEAALQATAFYDMTRSSLVGSTRLVKQIGDAVMLVADQASDAVATARTLMDAAAGETTLPLLRGGIHTGTAVESSGRSSIDYLGTGVNLAARVAASAAGHQLLLTGAVATALGPEWTLRSLGPMRFRNIALPVEIFELALSSPEGEIDPVCKMRIGPGAVIASLRHCERDYVFCSLQCVAAFAAHPDRYVGVEEGQS